eukprot:CAMPEP_0206377146 /NCGR_PEP_ID=MMETSP0294-20121207/9971_1 /ASSEMBLY_ACC=CAM_ASM_000327 /TAXON_ID=39354 /ORGANISM="Heterosigma akashiwo, Strain CCMP2393" /LENGTH=203 /DNA_ID=CAMNT_0053825541 /DNA_START=208 /DNA_END=816 /DNA_ORIENTATION=+
METFGEQNIQNEKPDIPKASQEMCAYCFDVLICAFDGTEPSDPRFPTDFECPFFVTWNKTERGGQRRLRGCIGTLSPRPVADLKDYTHSSAFRDRRFEPVGRAELGALQVAVSLLVRYEPAADWRDWEVGVHGILINFYSSRNEHYSATYLPEVAPEQGWGHLEAVSSLVRKAGYRGRVDDALLDSLEVTRYQSSKAKLDYAE